MPVTPMVSAIGQRRVRVPAIVVPPAEGDLTREKENVMTHAPRPAEPAHLPPYCAILVVDVTDFSGRRGRDHAALTDAIPQILRQTFRRCGLAEVWGDAVFCTGTGDGYVLGLRSALLPYLINPFLPALQDELDDRNASRPHDEPLRMRVTIHVGPVTATGSDLLSEGSGAARVQAHRLIDSHPVRDLISRSGPATCVAAIVSSRAFADAVLTGYAADDPDLYVEAPVQVKTYEGTAYLRVPKPSGGLLEHGFRPGGADDQAEPARAAVEARPGGPRVGGVGDVNGTGNVTVTGVDGPVNAGSGSQHIGPGFFGDGVNYVHGNNSGSMRHSDQVRRRSDTR